MKYDRNDNEQEWILIGYYTARTKYEDAFIRLVQQLEAARIRFDIARYRESDPAGYLQPATVRRAMERHPGESLLYVDIDAVIECDPFDLDSLFDDFQGAIGYVSTDDDPDPEIIFFNVAKYADQVDSFLSAWSEERVRDSESTRDEIFNRAVQSCSNIDIIEIDLDGIKTNEAIK